MNDIMQSFCTSKLTPPRSNEHLCRAEARISLLVEDDHEGEDEERGEEHVAKREAREHQLVPPPGRKLALLRPGVGVPVTVHRVTLEEQHLGDLYAESGQTLQASFSSVSKPQFATKYALQSSRRDLHNALLCTVLNAQFFVQKSLNFLPIFSPNFAKFDK